MNPTILFVPGLWEGPKVFAKVCTLLETLSFPTIVASLPSTGTTSPGNPTMHDDEAAIRVIVQKLVEEEEKDVVMVCHSAGGFLGSAAIEGLSVKARREKSLNGGVKWLLFLCAGVLPEGHQHAALPFMKDDIETGARTCVSPAISLFNDLSPEEAGKWLQELKPQPAQGWDGVILYAGWKEVGSTYLICENDKVLSVEVQQTMATFSSSKVVRCASGHMVMLSMPEKVVDLVREVCEGL